MTDHQLAALLDEELRLQRRSINLTAASNYLAPVVADSMRSELNNIHCEGYPGKRYHEGQAGADAIERLAIERACRLFGAEHANVQPYRGTMANLAACIAAVPGPGDGDDGREPILGFACDAGGHYTTGGQVHLAGRLFDVETYTVDPASHLLDLDEVRGVARQVLPRAIIGGDTAYPGAWDWAALRSIADEVGAVLIADISQTAGLVAAGVVDDPIPWADIVTLAAYKTLRGPRMGVILSTEAFAAQVDRAVHPVCQDGTDVRAIAGLAAALHEAAQPGFRAYCRQVLDNAAVMAGDLIDRGYDLITGGTTNHACLLDLTRRPFDGRKAAAALARAHLICNANQIPFDPCPPARPSGLRLGTPAITTLGMGGPEVAEIIRFVDEALFHADDPAALDRLAAEVVAFRCGFDGSPDDLLVTAAGRSHG